MSRSVGRVQFHVLQAILRLFGRPRLVGQHSGFSGVVTAGERQALCETLVQWSTPMPTDSAAPPLTPDLLGDIVKRILAVGAPYRIVLFGSRARGGARPDSDLDLLIVEDSNLPRYRRSPLYLRALVGVFPAKDVVVWTPAEIEAWRNVPQAFITTALREGQTLYER